MSEILANIPVELNEEDIIFTEEQQEKIEQMRKARAQLKTRETYVTNLNRFHDNPFIVGKPVFVNIEGTEFIGHIESDVVGPVHGTTKWSYCRCRCGAKGAVVLIGRVL